MTDVIERARSIRAEARKEQRLARSHRRRAQDLMEQLSRLCEANGIALETVEASGGMDTDGTDPHP